MTAAALSDLFVWSAATALTISLIAYSVDLARVTEAAQAARAVRRPVSVGAPDAPPAPELPDTPAPVGSRRAAGIAASTLVLAAALLAVGIALRGVAAGRWPTANMYEFTIFGIFWALVALVVQQRRRPIAFVGVLVSGIGVLGLVLALNTLHVRADAVQPALQRYWLVLHVGVAIIATGISTVAFATTVLQVLRDARAEGRSRLDRPWASADGVRRAFHGARVTGPAFAWLEQVPDARRLEASSFRQHAVAFVLWTLTLIGGAIWAEEAWGRYWGWDPKEVGTFVAWTVYAAYLHARTTRGWAGRRAAYLVFVAYTVVLLNFTVVNLFVSGKHSYSGL